MDERKNQMKHWIVDKTETLIIVHEEGNPSNYALREKAERTYDCFGTITGFKFDDDVIKQAYDICKYINKLERYRSE
jgi:hypothetical protein